ncbi:Abhydrolase domain-containing protein [Rhizoctonia solani]|uniref:Abhydrolase domain-containing protein n=1 Tax=Rhizoctonia solani TaxID=456999 RepID=A0A8H8SWR9_9AGAM|nr:Abhydrolase domain-containing protein [Rhizoctonia solani]QRW20654.1 Abhydrolase domain-containing protein [Rhizoctonia solani]
MTPLLSSLIVSAGLAAAAKTNNFPLPEGYHRYAPRSNEIKWGACSSSSVTGRECARFEVPLDWHNATAGKASLALARYKAINKPKLGTLFTNPGGPGGSGVASVLGESADLLMTASGGRYDIVSWDPRGVGDTVPLAECFKTGTEEKNFWKGTIASSGLEAGGNFTDKRDLDTFYGQVDEIDSLLKKLGRKCIEYSPDTFKYIGTAAVVRDMVAVHDILEGKEKAINYWGISYGTVIGSYFVNMFPNRVGQIVLDGVVDPVYWANRPPHLLWDVSLISSDEAFDGFCSACALAGPSGCAIAKENSTASSVRQWTQELLDKAYEHKKTLGSKAKVTSAEIRSFLFDSMYAPKYWQYTAQELAYYHDILSDTKSFANASHVRRTPITLRRGNNNTSAGAITASDIAPNYSFQGVTCADAIDANNVTTKDVFDMLVNTTRNVSPMFGPIWGDAGFYCHHWPASYLKISSRHPTANRLLGNEADPITPLVGAKNVADALGNSAALIEQDDYGHSSLAMHSNCTVAALQNYFVDNKLPTQDLFCGTNQVLFPTNGGAITKKIVDRTKLASNAKAVKSS